MKKAKQSSTIKDIVGRIDRRMKALRAQGNKITDRSASIEATGVPGTIDGIRKAARNGRQTGVRTGTLEKLAPVLQTTPEWLLNEVGSEVPTFDISSMEIGGAGDHGVPLLGYVRAGAEAVYLPLHESELDRIPAPAGATDKTRALEIRGDSLGELFDRWIVFFDDEQRPISPDLLNRLCIIALTDGRVLVKKIQRPADGGTGYDLMSNTEKPIRNAVIKWAARVKHMAPR